MSPVDWYWAAAGLLCLTAAGLLLVRLLRS